MDRCATLEPVNRGGASHNEIVGYEGQNNAAACPATAQNPSITLEVIDGYEVHPAASVLPNMPEKQFNDLVDSIAEHGLGEPVEFKGDLLVEGRHRLRAIEVLRERGVQVELRKAEWQPLPGETVPDYVRRKNVRRRHMTDSQLLQSTAALLVMADQERAAAGYVAGRIQPGEIRNPGGSNQYTPVGAAEDEETDPTPPSGRRLDNKTKTARSAAGRLAAETGQTVYKARQALAVLNKGTPEEIEAVASGKKSHAEVLKGIEAREANPTSRKQPKTIPHAFKPTTQLEHDLLAGWVRLSDSKVPVTEKASARAVMRAILKAEEAAERVAAESVEGGGK